MTKAKLNALAKLMNAEIEDHKNIFHGIFQSNAKVFTQLQADGFAEWHEFTLPSRWPVTIKGWRFTDAGRLAFCQACAELPEEAL